MKTQAPNKNESNGDGRHNVMDYGKNSDDRRSSVRVHAQHICSPQHNSNSPVSMFIHIMPPPTMTSLW